jgi:predicted phage terminase large subunit-like protein
MDRTIKALIRCHFFLFACKAIPAELGDDSYLRYLAYPIDQFARGEIRRLIINLPPGHLKTWLGSVCLAAWMLAHDPSLKIMLVTHAEVLSKDIARKIRTILLSAWFRAIFACRIEKGHGELTDFGTTAGGGVFVTSFRGSFTGRRADVIIVDDPHDIRDDLKQIESTIESFTTLLMSRLNNRKTGRVLVVAHRVHERDLSASLLRTQKWEQVALPLIATRDQTYETGSETWNRRKGELLRPDAYSPDVIEELREGCFSPDFEMLYQQDCDFQALPAISAEHFPTIKEAMPPGAPVVLSVDPGVGSGQKNAFSVIQAWRVGADRYHLIDQFREQSDFADLLDKVCRFCKLYRPVAILIERAANGNALISALRRKSRYYRHLVIQIVPDGRSKSARLRVHAETIIGKRIHLPADEPWADEFVSEFVKFPHGKFTDQVDATTQFLDRASEFVGVQPRAKGGMAVVGLNSSGRILSIQGLMSNQPSNGGEPGLFAGRYGYGLLMNIKVKH